MNIKSLLYVNLIPHYHCKYNITHVKIEHSLSYCLKHIIIKKIFLIL